MGGCGLNVAYIRQVLGATVLVSHNPCDNNLCFKAFNGRPKKHSCWLPLFVGCIYAILLSLFGMSGMSILHLVYEISVNGLELP